MTDADREIRVLHIVSDGAISAGLQPTLFMPLLTRAARQRVQTEVVCMAADAVPAAMLRQHGIPVHDIAFPSVGWSPRAAAEARQVARQFQPDIIQAWGLEAQLLSLALSKRCEPRPRLIWCVTHTEPEAAQAGWLVRRRLMQAVRASAGVERLVYASSASAARHVRLGFTGLQHEIINPGVDALRFKPDAQARARLREQLQVPKDSTVIGMHAPMQPGAGHEQLVRAASELVRSHPQIHLLLAGHGVNPGNAALMALMGNGVLATRSQLLGEWSDLPGFYNACDLVCAAGLDDAGRMQLAMAMLCGVPCVATGPGAQGEVIARHGAVVEPGNAKALLKGMQKMLELDASQRQKLVQAGRQHAMLNYVHVRTLQKYLHLYCDLLGIEQPVPAAAKAAPTAQPAAKPAAAVMAAVARNAAKCTLPAAAAARSDATTAAAAVVEPADDSLASDSQAALANLPKWRQEQEREQRRRAAKVAAAVAAASSEGDVLQLFEQKMQQPAKRESASAERARGVADESEILLPPEVLGMTVDMEVTEEALLAAGWRSEDAARLVASSRSPSNAAADSGTHRAPDQPQSPAEAQGSKAADESDTRAAHSDHSDGAVAADPAGVFRSLSEADISAVRDDPRRKPGDHPDAAQSDASSMAAIHASAVHIDSEVIDHQATRARSDADTLKTTADDTVHSDPDSVAAEPADAAPHAVTAMTDETEAAAPAAPAAPAETAAPAAADSGRLSADASQHIDVSAGSDAMDAEQAAASPLTEASAAEPHMSAAVIYRRLEDMELSLVATGTQPVISQPMLDAVSEVQALALLEDARTQRLDDSPLALVEDEPPRFSHSTAVMDR